MSDRPPINIEEKLYAPEAISEQCFAKLQNYQTTQNIIAALSTMLVCARKGADQELAEAKELLPEPLAETSSSAEDSPTGAEH